MDFQEILEYRKKYPIYSSRKDELFEAIKDNTYCYDFALLTMSLLSSEKDELFKNKYPDIIVQIPSPFINIGISFILIHFTSIKPKKFLTGIYSGRVHERGKRTLSKDSYYLTSDFTEDFADFLDNINNFVEGRELRREDLNVNDYSIFDLNNLNPFYYSKQAIKIRNELSISDYKLLKDIADIISAPTCKQIKGRLLSANMFDYSLKYKDLPNENILLPIKVKKGDIVALLIGEKPKFYLFNYDYDDVYIKSGNYCIVRPKNKTITNYLYWYLNDEKAQSHFFSYRKSSFIPSINKSDFSELKVIVPTQKMIDNSDRIVEYTFNIKKLSPVEINKIIRDMHSFAYKSESQKMVSDDILDAISRLKNKAIRELINDDLKEVEVCFDNQAYKSAIILCGSILEAVLLDWLSEFENTDDILNVAKGDDGKDLELTKIISKLKELVRPYWYESSKAHEIRKTRNMVHPKECIKNNVKVSMDDCERIINDLNDIIESKENRS